MLLKENFRGKIKFFSHWKQNVITDALFDFSTTYTIKIIWKII